ncbi:BT4734/BF3469 family protein [Flavobacterium hydrophilum]|nr:BT4734/BF3469 family protein [Flavobacterium hydrophilum]
MKNIIVSKFQNYRNPVPEKNVNLFEYLTDNTYKNIVEHIRTLTDKDEIKLYKSKLPAVTISGTFSTRNKIGLIQHSGHICIDIDGGDNSHIKDFKFVRDELKKIHNVSYASLSVSGRGAFCIIPIKNPEKHAEHFEALKIIFERFGIIIDKACKDVTRLRGYSYDPDAYFNEDAVVFTQLIEYKTKNSNTSNTKKDFTASYSIKGNSTQAKVMKIINQINLKKIDMTDDYNDWFQIACALANEFGEEGRDMFSLVSQNNSSYHPDIADNMYTECLERNYPFTIGTFFHLAEKHGLK